jgi:hypothetical protein
MMTTETIKKNFIGQISLTDMHKEIVREIGVRQRVYPNWIEQRKITQGEADYRILVLERLALELSLVINKKKPQQNLFDDSEVF